MGLPTAPPPMHVATISVVVNFNGQEISTILSLNGFRRCAGDKEDGSYLSL